MTLFVLGFVALVLVTCVLKVAEANRQGRLRGWWR